MRQASEVAVSGSTPRLISQDDKNLKTKLISDINRTDNGFLLAEDENCLQIVLSGFI